VAILSVFIILFIAVVASHVRHLQRRINHKLDKGLADGRGVSLWLVRVQSFLVLVTRWSNDEVHAAAWYNVGVSYVIRGRYDLGLTALDRGLAWTPTPNDDWPIRARSLEERARCLACLSRFPEAHAALREAEALRDEMNPWDRGSHLDHLEMRARVARFEGDYTSAERDLRFIIAVLESGEMSRRPHDAAALSPWPFPTPAVDVMETLARVLYLDGRVDEARALDAEALERARREKDPNELLSFVANMAVKRWRAGDFTSAAARFDELERLATEAGVELPPGYVGPANESRARAAAAIELEVEEAREVRRQPMRDAHGPPYR
jgi:tetratricopeptide (TPR) repeat protein